MTTLMQASRQWASRPSDERFTSLTELHDKVRRERHNSIQSVVSTRKIEVQPHPGDTRYGITIAGDCRPPIPSGLPARLAIYYGLAIVLGIYLAWRD